MRAARAVAWAPGGPARRSRRDDVDQPPLVALAEVDGAGRGGEEGVVGALHHVETGVITGAPLAHEDRARRHRLAGEALDAQALGLGVTAVAGAPAAFGLRHLFLL